MSDDAAPKFSAYLTPHRSLGPRGFLILMSFVAVISFVAGIFFLAIGAWPVMGFFGLDALAIYFAFRLNYRDARRFELVELNGSLLRITRVEASGRRREWEFNPYWVRLNLVRRDEDRSDIVLSSHGERLRIGDFLTGDEKRDFANSLGDALSDCRAGRLA